MLHLIRHLMIIRLLQPVAFKIDQIEIQNAKMARLFCRLIPSQCPFERDVCCFGRVLFHIPPMCKLNPFYEQLMYLRFKALSYLAETCNEDVALYCQ